MIIKEKRLGKKSSKLISETIKNITKTHPAVLTGDFNVTEDQEAYKIITDSFLKDAWHASEIDPIGPKFTFTGFEVSDFVNRTHGGRIDYIFVSSNLKVKKIRTISRVSDEEFLSDHIPVYSEIYSEL